MVRRTSDWSMIGPAVAFHRPRIEMNVRVVSLQRLMLLVTETIHKTKFEAVKKSVHLR